MTTHKRVAGLCLECKCKCMCILVFAMYIAIDKCHVSGCKISIYCVVQNFDGKNFDESGLRKS